MKIIIDSPPALLKAAACSASGPFWRAASYQSVSRASRPSHGGVTVGNTPFFTRSSKLTEKSDLVGNIMDLHSRIALSASQLKMAFL